MATDLKLWRIANDLSQQEMGKRAGIVQQRLSELERGLIPKEDELVKLARIGVPVAQFYLIGQACPSAGQQVAAG